MAWRWPISAETCCKQRVSIYITETFLALISSDTVVDATLAHPPSQDILKSEQHNLINTDKLVVSASENCKVETVRVETDKQQARGRLQRL